ncbi:fungal zn(2)-Cys(6) binuclear cluster domain-containing protein [Sarocladium implicatum]|nr:fungal zn(2)-Cys(6) binuclear cluster domain-containing protein [Sarocladium implicatum]
MAELRRACDRCHSKKLRCVRLATTDVCSRCERAQVSCVSSPPGRSSRNNETQLNDSEFDWAAFLDESQQQCPPANLWAPQQGFLDNPLGPELPRLSALMDRADQLYATLPGEHMYHYSPDMALQQRQEITQAAELQNTMERFVELLQQLDVIYPAACVRAASMDLDLDTLCSIEQCVHLGSQKTSFLEERPRFDYTLIQAVLTYHQRLLDIAFVILDNGLRCGAGVAFMEPDDISFDVPHVRIGSLTVSKSTAATVWLNLVRDSMESLTKRVASLPAILEAVKRRNEDQSDLVRLQSRIILKRTETGKQKLKELRSHMSALGLVDA